MKIILWLSGLGVILIIAKLTELFDMQSSLWWVVIFCCYLPFFIWVCRGFVETLEILRRHHDE